MVLSVQEVREVLGSQLRERRTALRLSQTELANHLGVSQTTITRWERGAREIEHPIILHRAMRDLERELAQPCTDSTRALDTA
jgi:transcriptional regulator with XRE-family HTH domain